MTDRRVAWLGVALIGVGAILIGAAAALGGVGPGSWMDGMHRSMWGWERDRAAPPATAEPGAAELLVVTTEFAFAPDRLELASGSPVNLRLRNDGALPHDLTIEGTDFSLLVGPGETAVALLPRLTAGEYRYFCSIAGHAEAGMTGTLVVTAAPAS